jgi:signal transduction histidine kinase
MRERAAKIGAEVDIQSSPGHGTRVTLRIPTPGASLRLAG